jgi:hypothetical protein
VESRAAAFGVDEAEGAGREPHDACDRIPDARLRHSRSELHRVPPAGEVANAEARAGHAQTSDKTR